MRTMISARWLAPLALALLVACGEDGGGPGVQDAGLDAALEDAQPDASPEAGVDPRLIPLTEALEQELAYLGVAGMAVAVLEGGEVTYAAGYGAKHPDEAGPVQATTLFRIGSVNKMLTAVGLLQQVEAGLVTLDASVTDPLPELGFTQDPNWAPAIRVEDLLTHSSAIVDYGQLDAGAAYQNDDGLAAYLLDGPFESLHLMAPPGRFYNYTNPGYMLAGLITERVTGTYYRTYLTDEVLLPLGMHRTYFLAGEVLADGDYASGDTLHWQSGQPVVVGPSSYDNPWARPAGFAWSSVLDLAEFVKFLRNGAPAVLADDQREAMMSPQRDMQTFLDQQQYGYGLVVIEGFFLGEDFYDITLIVHDGAIPGYSASLYWLGALDFGFVALANGDGAYFVSSLVTALETLCDLPAPVTPPDLSVDPADFDRYAGDYDDPYNVGPVTVTMDGSDLRVSMPLLDSLSIPYDPLLEPVLPHNFLLMVQGVQIPLTFILDGNGQGEFFRTRPFVATRRAAAPPLPMPLPPRERLLRLLDRARRAPDPWRLVLPASHPLRRCYSR